MAAVTRPVWVLWAGPAARHWPRLAAVSVLDLVIGVLALAWPGVTVLALALMLGIVLLLSGLASVAFGVRLRSAGIAGGWPIVLGVISIVAAVICLLRPGTGVLAIALIVGLWFFLTGVMDLARAFSVRDDRAWWGVLGALSVIAGIVLMFDVGAAVLTIALIVGVCFLLRGVSEMMIAMRLRRLHRSVAAPP